MDVFATFVMYNIDDYTIRVRFYKFQLRIGQYIDDINNRREGHLPKCSDASICSCKEYIHDTVKSLIHEVVETLAVPYAIYVPYHLSHCDKRCNICSYCIKDGKDTYGNFSLIPNAKWTTLTV